MKIYTGKGDDGTTSLLYGGRVAKASKVMDALGAIDEAQAVFGVVRAGVEAAGRLDRVLVDVEHHLYVLMAEVATAPANRAKLTAGVSRVTDEMVRALEVVIDELTAEFPPLKNFAIPGHDPTSAGLDLARAVVRRAERALWGVEGDDAVASDTLAPTYLNRLSDLAWTMARWCEHGETLRVGGGHGSP